MAGGRAVLPNASDRPLGRQKTRAHPPCPGGPMGFRPESHFTVMEEELNAIQGHVQIFGVCTGVDQLDEEDGLSSRSGGRLRETCKSDGSSEARKYQAESRR